MARGIELPTKAVNGRLKMLGGDEYIEQLVMTMLGDGDSDNPFQDLGLGQFMIFGINDAQQEGEIREKVKAGFAILQRDQLAKLRKLTFDREGSESRMFVEYVNLETGERVELEVPLPEGSA